MWMTAAILICGGLSVQAQDNCKHEIAVSYGVAPFSDVYDAFDTFTSVILGAKYDNEKFFGPISAEYFYRVSPLIGVGGIFVYANHHEDVLSNKVNVGERKKDFITVMPAVKFNWLRKETMSLYSKVAVGCTFASISEETAEDNVKRKSDDNETFFNFQLSAIGIEAGKSLRFFAELGYGEQGVVFAGLRYRF